MLIVEDESDYVQYGQSEETSFFSMIQDVAKPSSERDNLLEKPDGAFKFGSLEVVTQPTTKIVSR